MEADARNHEYNRKKYEDELERERKEKWLQDEKAAAVKKANEKLERNMLDHESMEKSRIQRDVELKEMEARNIAKVQKEMKDKLIQEMADTRHQ